MGWLEFKAWLAEMNRQRRGAEPDPESWRGAENDPWWREMEQKRRDERGW